MDDYEPVGDPDDEGFPIWEPDRFPPVPLVRRERPAGEPAPQRPALVAEVVGVAGLALLALGLYLLAGLSWLLLFAGALLFVIALAPRTER